MNSDPFSQLFEGNLDKGRYVLAYLQGLEYLGMNKVRELNNSNRLLARLLVFSILSNFEFKEGIDSEFYYHLIGSIK